MRSLAKERGITLIELGQEAENDGGIIDHMMDDRSKELGLTRDQFVIDGRLAFWCIPHSFKLFLTVPPEEAARRIYTQEEGRIADGYNTSLSAAAENIRLRRESENDRYMKYYGVHIYDFDLYDAVIDTSDISPEEVLRQAVMSIETWRQKGLHTGV